MLPKFFIDLKDQSFWFTDANRREILVEIEKLILSRKKFYVVTPNPEFLMLAQKDKEFAEILDKAEISLPDGIGIILAKKVQSSRLKVKSFRKQKIYHFISHISYFTHLIFLIPLLLFGKFKNERVSGSDLMIDLCKLAKKKKWRVFFLGAKKGIGSKTALSLFKSSPNDFFANARSSDFRTIDKFSKLARGKTMSEGNESPENFLEDSFSTLLKNDWLWISSQWAAYSGDGSPAGDKETVGAVKKASRAFGEDIDLLFVAYGMGKQERWIKRNLKKLRVKMAMGVGGSFDYLAGVVPRAPKWMQNRGLEWFWRLIREPWRLKRQLVIVKFLLQVISTS